MEGSCEYIEKAVADSRQGVVLQLGGLAWGYQIITVKNMLVTKILKKPQTWTDPLDKRPKRKKMDMIFGTDCV
jgi:mitochondrial fission protein ELM1